jgi:heptosyltransferase-1
MTDRRRILIVRLGSMGDILHSLPVLASIEESFPDWEVDWLVEPRWRPLLEGIPYLSRIVNLDTLGWRKDPLSAESWNGMRGALEALRERRYDCALDLQASIKSAAACYLSGAREILGFETPWLKEPACGVFYTRRVAATGTVHMVETNLALAAALGAKSSPVRFPLPSGNPELLPEGLSGGGWAVVNPGAGWRSKLWPAARYAQVCDALGKSDSLPVVLNCGPGEEELAREVTRACEHAHPCIFSGEILGLIALLRRSRLMVGPDTGPVHLAAALGVPTVGLFGPTDPQRNGPYGARRKSLRPEGAITSHSRSTASAEIMERIPTEQVLEAIREVLEKE